MSKTESFRDRVKIRIVGLGLTQDKVAERMGVKRNTFASWLMRGCFPATHKEIFLKVLEVSAIEFDSWGGKLCQVRVPL